MQDADAYRSESRERWNQASAAWEAHADAIARVTMPVASWMVDALEPQPGQTILELAAGTGDVGFLAAELLQPGGELITSDFAPGMLSGAQRRAAALGIKNVRFKQIDAESIDAEAGSLDGVLVRWGLMLMADPGAALREIRRVLRPGGRLALAAWASAPENPWVSLVGREFAERELVPPPAPGEPHQFSWADRGVIERELEDAGFVEFSIEPLDFSYRFESFDAWWDTVTTLGARVKQALDGLDAPTQEEIRTAVRTAAAPFAREDGSFGLPARTWVAWASA